MAYVLYAHEEGIAFGQLAAAAVGAAAKHADCVLTSLLTLVTANAAGS